MGWSFRMREANAAPVRCNWCRAPLALQGPGGLTPSPADLHELGAVSVKRVGWFCSRRCVGSYEVRFRVILEPETLDGQEPRTA